MSDAIEVTTRIEVSSRDGHVRLVINGAETLMSHALAAKLGDSLLLTAERIAKARAK